MVESVLLQTSSGDSAVVHLHGASVTSWKCKGKEMLFLSEKAVFDGKKAIRGGIPIVFPNFGPWDLGPQHGFARISQWNVEQEPSKDGNETVAVFTLENSKSTSMWPYRFKLTYRVTLGDCKLTTTLIVVNRDEKAFDFTTLLHTYFKVPDVTKTSVSGFKGLSYVDKIREGKTFEETNEPIIVDCLTDRVYKNSPSEHIIANSAFGAKIVLQKENLPDTVVWNPWAEKAKAMSDFGDEEYTTMLCVEAGYVNKPYTLAPGQTFEASQTLNCTCI